jgi:PQQ-dependent dehydrogenase (methanol/ethanol family)
MECARGKPTRSLVSGSDGFRFLFLAANFSEHFPRLLGYLAEEPHMIRSLRNARPLTAQVLAVAVACGTAALPVGAQGAQQPPSAQKQEPPPLFARTCALCHGADAQGTDRGPSLVDSVELRSLPDSNISDIIRKGKAKMPAFPLPAAEIDALVRYIRLLSPTESATAVAGDPKSGEHIFFGSGRCSTCHMVRGRGAPKGPDLSDVGRRLRLEELKEFLTDPDARIADGWGTISAKLTDGRTLHGFVRAQGSHDLVLETNDGKLHLLLDSEYKALTPDKHSAMPAYKGTEDELQSLVAYLSSLKGVGVGPLSEPQLPPTRAEIEEIVHPKKEDWPTYNGTLDGNRFSHLDQVNLNSVGKLQLQWTYSFPFNGLETTPVVVHGVMYATGNNQVYALSGKTGREIWRYQRPKSVAGTIASDAAIGVNRGVAMLGDRIFYLTDDAHLIALHRLTGALLWDVDTPQGAKGLYGGTSAPLVVGDLVITGVSGGDNGIRGFVAAYKATTGELAWKLYTIPNPGDTGPAADTWKGSALGLGGGATWLTGSADTKTNILYWAAGNPHPDTDGDERIGSNLYTNSDLAIDVNTGKMLWYYQFTPHDLHDWDANEPIVLVNAKWKGQDRKLLLHANRNGYLYVLDRTTGTPLMATKMVRKLNWASGIDEHTWAPQLLPENETSLQGTVTCPAVRGATNWYSTAYNPATKLYYVMTVEDCTTYVKAEDAGYRRYNNLADPAQKILRAFDIETGKVAWRIVLPGPLQSNYSGVLTTSGGLVFFGESSGGFAAVDARNGKYLWHFETNHAIRASPMTYAIDGRQYIAIASGSNILSFALPK